MIVCTALIASATVDPGERFLREYPDQVGELKARLEGTRGTADLRGVVNGKGGPARLIRFATRPGTVKYEFDAGDRNTIAKGSGEAVVYCRVDRHCFRLKKERGAPEYTVTMYGNGLIENALVNHDFAQYVEAPWKIANTTISELLKKPQFKLLEAREVTDRGRSLIAAVFESGDVSEKIAKVQATFDPGLSWAIVRAELSPSGTNGRTVQSDVEYTESSDGEFFVGSVQTKGLDSRTYRCDFRQVEFVAVPETEFTMARYGLKDPARKTAGEPTWMYWLAGFSAFAVLALLGWWSRRLASRMSWHGGPRSNGGSIA